jgi:hypothetical protein
MIEVSQYRLQIMRYNHSLKKKKQHDPGTKSMQQNREVINTYNYIWLLFDKGKLYTGEKKAYPKAED